ncbi:tetratricopeptide repeat protein [Symmachiella dynata]|uniref:tetratricopeptide repeat protein n=1 Tax=Symmachiella dynata TaxID=2527995 RepID=UPI0030EF6DD8
MRNRFSCLLASLSISLIISSGCTPWGNLQFDRAAAQRPGDEAQSEASHPPVEESPNEDFAADNRIGTQNQPLEGQEFDHSQRNEASQNDFLLGRRAEDAGELESARRFYQNVLRKHPTHAHAHHRLGVVADKMQNFAEAERHYESALNYMSPDNRQEISIVFSDLGYSYLLRGDFPQSERALNNALAYHADSRIAIRNLALLHGYRGDFEMAYQKFASVGGEAEARAELDRLFPHWQDKSPAGQMAQTTEISSPALAAKDNPPQPTASSSAFPTSRVPDSRGFPQQSSRTAPAVASTQTSQHLTFDTATPIDPASMNRAQPQSPTPQRLTMAATPPKQPLQAPPPHEYLADNIPGQYTAPPAQPATTEQQTHPTSQITQVGYTADPQPQHRQPPATAPAIQNPGRAAPQIAIQVDSFQAQPSNQAASRTALAIGGAIGLGGMFPTSRIEPSQTIQQVSAKAPHSLQFDRNPPIQMPPATPPGNAPSGLIRSPNPASDRIAPIPSPNATNYRVSPIGNSNQQANAPANSVPNTLATPQSLPAYNAVR